jgi:hypothetical protein
LVDNHDHRGLDVETRVVDGNARFSSIIVENLLTCFSLS